MIAALRSVAQRLLPIHIRERVRSRIFELWFKPTLDDALVQQDIFLRAELARQSNWDPTARALGPEQLRIDRPIVTDELFGRLGGQLVSDIEAHVRDDQTAVEIPGALGAVPRKGRFADVWESSDEIDRHRIAIALGLYFEPERVAAATGLSTAAPSDEVHAMGRGPLSTGGSAYHADLVATALNSADMPIGDGMSILDFGCSSGRVLRMLRAAYPEVRFAGSDPNAPAIEWASANLDGIDFRVGPLRPPLSFDTDQFDAAFGISIWSHFDEEPGLAWLEEMARIVKSGGTLIVTTHGWHSVAHYARQGLRSHEQLEEVRRHLFEHGYWFAAEFGEAGDWGVVDSGWGTSFLTAEWLLGATRDNWELVDFAAARNEGNQDVFVLRRR